LIFDKIKSTDNEPVTSLPSISFLFPKLDVQGITLECDELYAIGVFTEQGLALHKWLGIQPQLPNIESHLPQCQKIISGIFHVIDKSISP